MLRPSIFSSATYATGAVAECRALAHALVEGAQLLVVVGVVEAEHRREVLDGREAVDRPPGDALRRRIGRDEIGMLGLELLELVQQPIELLVGDLRIVVDVVALFVMADRVAKLADALRAMKLTATLNRSSSDAVYRSRDRT